MRALFVTMLLLVAGTAHALPGVEDVQSAVRRGDYPGAESMMRQVIAAKPENAKAHYVLAEILAHEGRSDDAAHQAATARQLDPAIHFTQPERFRQFESELAAATRQARPIRMEQGGGTRSGSSGFWILALLAIGALFFLFRRGRPSIATGYGNAGVPPAGTPSPMPGMPPGWTPGAPMQGSGVGSSVAAGLGGLAAGMLAEHMIEGMTHHHPQDPASGIFPSAGADAAADDELRRRPIDFGNDSGWGSDSDSSASSSGGGIDTGGSDDWT
ncbi:tetratricopeptide repeat protein [Dokdonella soli]|uniref:Tetratricopeptide repeat protein n=1 Tax=Dokdonella soli TaxID=529810 RepID=A0ABP3U6M5_9GAMM